MPWSRLIRSFTIPIFVLLLGPQTVQGSGLPSGADLYNEHCAACHRPLNRTPLHERPVNRIRSAIRVFPSMVHLGSLSDADLQAIAQALANPGH